MNDLLLIFLVVGFAWIPRTLANAMTTDPINDPWDFELMDVNAKFQNGQSSYPVITVTYVMNAARQPQAGGEEQMAVRVYHHSCSGDGVAGDVIYPRPNDPIALSSASSSDSTSSSLSRSENGNGLQAWDVMLEMNTRNVFNDTILTTGTPDDFRVRMCVRAEMWNTFEGSSRMISFDETNVEVAIQLTTNLTPVSINTTAEIRKEVVSGADVEYLVAACMCTDTYQCVDNPERNPNQVIRICVRTTDSKVEMLDIRVMDLYQGNAWRTRAVNERQADRLTSSKKFLVDVDGSDVCVVETPATVDFFDGQTDPAPITVTGTALMKFKSRRRLRRFLNANSEVAGEGDFSLSITLIQNPNPPITSKTVQCMIVLAWLVAALTAFGAHKAYPQSILHGPATVPKSAVIPYPETHAYNVV